jgi:ubiquinone/menaquinone biosynthesis C-methylase UbiE
VVLVSIDKKRIEDSYDNQAETYQGWKGYAKLLLRDIKVPDNPICLDIGCGDGLTTFGLYEFYDMKGEIHGVDISQKMIDKANDTQKKIGYDKIRFIKGDAESLDYPDNMFDVVISSFTFQFLPDKLKALREMYRVLKPSGCMALFFPAGKGFQEFQIECFNLFRMIMKKYPGFTRLRDVLAEYDEMHLSLEEFQKMIVGVGFTGLDFFGKHRVEYFDFKEYFSLNPYPVDLMFAVPFEFRDRVKEEIFSEVERSSDLKRFKLTRYFIQGTAKKP